MADVKTELKTRLALVLALVVATTAARRSAIQNATFASSDVATQKTAAILAFNEPAPLDFETATFEPPTASCHSATSAPLADGRLFVAWYGGTREGARDVKIYGATLSTRGETSAPRVLLDRSRLSRDVWRSIRKLGNPVVYAQNERLFLFVTSVSYGGWSGSSLNVATSDDGGETWSRFRRLRTTPLFNISSLVRAEAIPRSDGGFLLPAYCESATKYGLALAFDASGRLVDRAKTPIAENARALQPTIVPLSARRASAFLRVEEGGVGVSESFDGGATWRPRPRLPLENPNASVAAALSDDGRFVLVGNPGDGGRSRLLVWTADPTDSTRWTEVATLENEPGCEFSYPFLTRWNGELCVVYTWKRKAIKAANLTAILQSGAKTEGESK